MWDWYEKSTPLPADGIRAQSREFGKTWWAGRWLVALTDLIHPGRLARGRSYARNGQVLNLDVTPGRVDARVQGSRRTPYTVKLEIKPLSEAAWNRVVDAMAGQALFAAKLLAGEMPRTIEDAFAAAGASLFPSRKGDLRTDCSCPDWENPCKHVAAVYLLLGEQFDADPFLLFRLRGKTRAEIMAMLRARRSGTVARTRAAPRPPRPKKLAPPERVVPLASQLDTFWTAGDPLDDFRVNVRAAEVDAAPVKRLGPPGYWHGKEDFDDLFDVAYHRVTDAALGVLRE